ncbi:MAG: hypothetical protein WKF70_15290 [Chitinophagaceae bacterium]
MTALVFVVTPAAFIPRPGIEPQASFDLKLEKSIYVRQTKASPQTTLYRCS